MTKEKLYKWAFVSCLAGRVLEPFFKSDSQPNAALPSDPKAPKQATPKWG